MRLYIDPGTGSMLFTILLGIIGAAIYALKGLAIKVRFLISGGKETNTDEKRLPFVIFSDDKRYWNIFGPICREFDRRGQEVTYMTASPDDPGLKESFQHVHCQFIGEGNKAYAKLNLLRADILLSTTPGLDVYQWKRSKEVNYYVHILHMISDPTIYRMFGLDYYDAVLLTGEYQVRQERQLEKMRNLPPKELVLTGQPYMDGLLERLERQPRLEDDHPITVLLAPSWGPSSILNRYGKRVIDALLATGYHLVIRPHPQSFSSEKELINGLMEAYPQGEQIEWNRDNDNFDVLRRSDIMISDFSGVIFDFSLVFNKPVIYVDTAFDPAPYDAWWLQEETWTFATLPKIGRKLTENDLPNMKKMIDNCLADPEAEAAREAARRESWVNIGKSVTCTVDYLMKKHDELMADAAD